jgi:phospholipid/cholesterol/gamma-HCH transport system permease protein
MSESEQESSSNNFFGNVGRTAAMVFVGISRLYQLLSDVMRVLFVSLFRPKTIKPQHVFHQIVLMGVESLGIICLLGTSVGMVLALQAAYQLKDFGAVLYTGSLVSVSMFRELGPLVAGVLISGRVGARMAAELGTMKVQEEIDALTTMGLNPVRYLVAPRCLALLIVLPCLTIVTNITGMIGGFLIGTFGVGINPYMYIAKTFDPMVYKDIYTGLVKSGIFAILIALVSCHQGLSVDGGADGVGKATTQAVVTSIILIVIFDCITTAVFYYAFPG